MKRMSARRFVETAELARTGKYESVKKKPVTW